MAIASLRTLERSTKNEYELEDLIPNSQPDDVSFQGMVRFPELEDTTFASAAIPNQSVERFYLVPAATPLQDVADRVSSLACLGVRIPYIDLTATQAGIVSATMPIRTSAYPV